MARPYPGARGGKRAVRGYGGNVTVPSSPVLRVALLALMVALAVASLVAVVGGPDPLGEGGSVIFGLVLVAWFGAADRDAAGEHGLVRLGLAAGAVVAAAAVVNVFT
jgi:hypothetical protein